MYSLLILRSQVHCTSSLIAQHPRLAELQRGPSGPFVACKSQEMLSESVKYLIREIRVLRSFLRIPNTYVSQSCRVPCRHT